MRYDKGSSKTNEQRASHLVDGVSHGVAASLEASRHLVAPAAESERDEEGGDEDHDAHQAANQHVDEG